MVAMALTAGAGVRHRSGEALATFDDPIQFSVGDYPFAMAAADFDGAGDEELDGYPDLVVVNSGVNEIFGGDWEELDGTITVFRNTGDWDPPSDGLQVVQTIMVCSDCVPTDVALADLNGDDYPDLIVAAADRCDSDFYDCSSYGAGVYTYLWDPDPSARRFDDTQTNQYYSLAKPVKGLVVADFDGDGLKDVATAVDSWTNDGAGDVIFVNLNDEENPGLLLPAETFGLGNSDSPGPSTEVVGANFNRIPVFGQAGVIDILNSYRLHSSLSMSTNDSTPGDLAFDSERLDDCEDTDAPDWDFEDMATARFHSGSNNDDVAAMRADGGIVFIFHGNGDGTFDRDCDGPPFDDDISITWTGTGGCSPLILSPAGLDVGHLNGGTKVDIVATYPGCNQVVMLLGKGDGTFQLNTSGSAYYIPTKVGSQSADWPIEVLIVDFDQDGFGDLVTSNHLTGNISVMINEMVATNP